MPAKVQEKFRENIEYMLWIGMTLGEIQVVYPHISNYVIRDVGKKMHIETSTSRRIEKLKTRNTAVIQKFLTGLLEKETLENPEKVKLLIERIGEIDPTSRKHRFKKSLIEKAQKESYQNDTTQSSSSNRTLHDQEER